MHINRKLIFLLITSSIVLLKKDDISKYHNNYFPTFSIGNNKLDDFIDDSFSLEQMKNYTPQGMVKVDNNLVISMHDDGYVDNSVLLLVNNELNYSKKIELDINAHCGGIAYDEINDYLWITGKDGDILAYDYDDLLETNYIERVEEVTVGDDLVNHTGDNAVSYLTYYDEHLYLGNFNIWGNNTFMKKYEVEKGGSLSFVKTIKMPNYIQGVSFDDENMYVSRSWGRYNLSEVNIYKYDEDIDDYTVVDNENYVTPSLQQQLFVVDDSMYILYESNSNKFNEFVLKRSDDIVKINLKK